MVTICWNISKSSKNSEYKQKSRIYTIELDDAMKAINPVTGQTTTLTKINGLTLYNNGDKPIQFKSGNIAAITAIFSK